MGHVAIPKRYGALQRGERLVNVAQQAVAAREIVIDGRVRRAQPHEAADVTLAVVESAKLSTTVTEEGNMITDLVCYLRNSRK